MLLPWSGFELPSHECEFITLTTILRSIIGHKIGYIIRVYNDMFISIDQGVGATLVLLELSSAFDTIDHAVLFNYLII